MTDTELHRLKADLLARLRDSGAYRVGIADLGSGVGDEASRVYNSWIERDCNGEMTYLAAHSDLRDDPRLLLEGAKSIICCAFNYYYPLPDSPLRWARYALGDDYHEVLRRRLSEVARWFTGQTGAECRVCVDTAPLRERYWASRAGVGFIGLNNHLIIPGAGTHFLLGEILTTLPLPPDTPCTATCGNCRRCIARCPGHALDGDGSIDARRCISYLTIEYRGDLPAVIPYGDHIYGCDECQEACPHNSAPPVSEIPEFLPRPDILSLTTEKILSLDQPSFSGIFSHSAVKRTKLAGLRRNAATLSQEKGHKE